VAYFKVLYWHFSGGTEENHENLSHESGSPDRYFNSGPPEYETRVLTTRLWRSVVEEWSFITRFLANTLHHFVCFTRTSVSHSHPTPMSLEPILCPPLYWGFLSHWHTVGLLWTSDRPVAQASTYTGQHNIQTQGTNIQALSRIRTRDPSNQRGRRAKP
jgi:hypothetical protein